MYTEEYLCIWFPDRTIYIALALPPRSRGRCSYARIRATVAPSTSRHTMKGSAVVAIGVDRGGVGCDNAPAGASLAKAEKGPYASRPPVRHSEKLSLGCVVS
jgi:hypothetical protein